MELWEEIADDYSACMVMAELFLFQNSEGYKILFKLRIIIEWKVLPIFFFALSKKQFPHEISRDYLKYSNKRKSSSEEFER